MPKTIPTTAEKREAKTTETTVTIVAQPAK
jgi:hypothetical protein